MTIYATMNPVGSTNPKDLSDNAQNLDYLILGPLLSYPDRLGVNRLSWAGIETSFAAAQAQRAADFATAQAQRAADYAASEASRGYENPVPYAAGIALTRVTQLVQYNSELYKAKAGTLPWTTTGVWATDSTKLVSVGDAALRQNLADPANDLVAWERDAPGILPTDTVHRALNRKLIDVWDKRFVDLITDKPNPEDASTWNWSPAVQAAVTYAWSLRKDYGATALLTGKAVTSFPAIVFPLGDYKFYDVKAPTGIKILCFDNPIFRTDDLTKNLFVVDTALTNPRSFFLSEFSGFSVIKSKGLFNIDGPDETMSRVTVHRCTFAGNQVVFSIARASCILDVYDCRFDYNWHIADGFCDHAHFHDCWMEAGQLKFDGDAVFNIIGTGSKSEWFFTNILGVPNHPNQPRFVAAGIGIPGLKDLAWVNATDAKTVKFDNFRGGGEMSGLTAINWRVPFTRDGQRSGLYATSLIVKNSHITDANRVDYGDGSAAGSDSNPCAIRLFSLPNIFTYEGCSGNNQDRYAIGVGSTITSQADLIAKSQDPTDTANTGLASLRGLKWRIGQVTDTLFLSGGEFFHPYVKLIAEAIPRKRIKYHFNELTAVDYKAVYDKVGRTIALRVDPFLMPPAERGSDTTTADIGVRGIYEVSIKFNPTETWQRRVFKKYRVEVTMTTTTGNGTDVVTVTELYSKVPAAFASAGVLTAQLALNGTLKGTTVVYDTNGAWDEVYLSISLAGTTLIDKCEIEVLRVMADNE